MKKMLRACFITSYFFLLAPIRGVSAGIEPIKNFGNNPGNLRMYVYNPFEKKDTVKRQLVIVLHGCNQSAASVAELTGWNKLASLYNFYVLYPEQKMANNGSSCFNWFLQNDIEKGKGENASILTMIGYMQESYGIDSSQIFITGMSAGGAMTMVMLSLYPGKFNAGASFAGLPYKAATTPLEAIPAARGTVTKTRAEWAKLVTEQNPGYEKKYPRLFIYQGKEDRVVNKENALLIATQWLGVQKMDTTGYIPEFNYKNITGLHRFAYVDENKKEILVYYLSEKTGHKYLIKPGNKNNEGGKSGLFSAETGFHATWQTAVDFGLIRE